MATSEKRNAVLTHESVVQLPPGCVLGTGEPIPFTFKSLWGPAVLNPLNHKSLTIPALNLRSPHARNFHLLVLFFLLHLDYLRRYPLQVVAWILRRIVQPFYISLHSTSGTHSHTASRGSPSLPSSLKPSRQISTSLRLKSVSSHLPQRSITNERKQTTRTSSASHLPSASASLLVL